MRRSAILTLATSLLIPTHSFPQDSLASVQSQIQQRIASSHADVAVYFHSLDSTTNWSFHPDDAFHAASAMKIPVMIELFHQAREGKLRLTDALAIHKEFHSIVDGTPYQLNPKDDSETDLYKAEGQTRTLAPLCELMITVRSNLATNLLIQKLDVDNIRATVHSLGADGMNLLRGVEDQKAFDKGLNNTTTARALGLLLTAIANGQAVDAESSRQMIAILEKQHCNEGIPAGLPAGTRVAHKTGEITKIHHDAAIVYGPHPFILVILVRGPADEKDCSAVIADITRILYHASP